MKSIALLIAAIFLMITVYAQTPQSFRYQAVARDNSGNILANQAVSFRISILSGSISGTEVYKETHTSLTNTFGLVELEIGKGIPVTGTFSSINWGSNSYFVKIEMDPAGGSAYQELSTSQLLSVPYALHANTVQTGDNWGTQSVATDAALTGNGLVANPLKISDNAITSAKIADGAVSNTDLAGNSVTSDKLASNSVISAKIAAGAVTGEKIAQAGATSGQALKWNGTIWAPAADATGGGGWTDDGEIVRLTTTTDTVQIGSGKRLGKFNVGGDIGLNLLNSIYFGSDATRISSLTGGDLRFVAEDLSMLTTEDITFGHFGDETWIKFDNANKRVGIGTLSPTDRLHVVQNVATAGLSAIKGVATPTNVSNNGVYGESMSSTGYGLFGKSPKYGVYGTATGNQGRGVAGEATGESSIGVYGIATNTNSTGVWGEGSNQGVYGKSDLATGKGVYGQVTSATGYSGYFNGGKFYISGNTGIGTTNPAKKLHVYGSAQVKDTLYANVVNAAKVTTMPGIAHSTVGTSFSLPTSWGVLNSVTLNVPTPGYVLLMVSCEFASNHTYNDRTSVTMGISKTSDGTGIKEVMNWYVSFNRASDWITDEISSQGALQVTTSGLQTFYFMGKRQGGDGYDEVHRYTCNLTAIYFPVAYGTVE